MPYSALNNVQAIGVDENNRSVQSVSVPAGKCQTVVVSLGTGASGVGVAAVIGRDVIARGYGSEVTTMPLCGGSSSQRAEVRVTVASGQTQALVGVLDR